MFTVVIPLYNKELSIKNTIQSVLNQTYQEFEIVVINDGSTDNSTRIVEAINDNRIKLTHQENQGVSTARNRGIKMANNEWIAFLDGDDLWKVNHLEEITKMMQKFPNQKVYVTSFEYSDKRPMFRHSRTESVFEVESYFKEAIKERLMWTSIVVVHKSCINKVGDFNERLNRGEDLDLWARLVREYTAIKSAKVTAVYNMDGADLSLGKSIYIKSVLSIIDLKGLKGYERKYYKRMLINRLKYDIKTLDLSEILILIFKHNFQLII